MLQLNHRFWGSRGRNPFFSCRFPADQLPKEWPPQPPNQACLEIGATCYRTEKARISKSARESAGKSAGEKGDCWGDYWNSAGRGGLVRRSRGTALFPAVPLFTGTLPSTLPGTFGDSGFLSPVAGGPNLKACQVCILHVRHTSEREGVLLQ